MTSKPASNRAKLARTVRRLSTTRHFLQDRHGNVAMMFALSSVPIVIALGAGLDYARARAEQIQLQQGADAAALAGLQSVHKGVLLPDANPLIQQVVKTNDPNPAASATNVTMSADNSTLCVTASSQTPTALMGMVGIRSMTIGAYACSKSQTDTYEIAFAIDNSGSMNNSAANGKTKIQSAIEAAEGLITAMSASTGATIPTSYSLTPFSLAVNVGSQYAGAAWMDTAAKSSIHWNNYLRPTSVTSSLPKSRFDMFTNIGGAWGGCVEERPSPYTTTDTKASDSNNALFVPFLAPDENDASSSVNDYMDDMSGACQSNDVYASWDRNYSPGRGDGQTKLCKYMKKGTSVHLVVPTLCIPIPFLISCPTTTGSTGTDGWGGSGSASSDSVRDPSGANAGCSSQPLTTLTSSTTVIKSNIEKMTAKGDTALLPGFMWAWRTISPNGPFADSSTVLPVAGGALTGVQSPKPYGYFAPSGAANHKVIILLTDGMNHWSGQLESTSAYNFVSQDPNKSVYSALGFFGDARLGATTASNARSLLDATTLQACNNAKTAGIEVFTVGFLASDGIDAAGKSLLGSCATDSGHNFIATDGTQLVQVFQQIASSLTQPRLVR